MDRYSLQAIAAEAMNHTNEVVYQRNYLLQDAHLQRRIDSVRERIRSMREFARERAVNLEEIPEVTHLERALDACPLAPVRDEISESLSSPESNSHTPTSEATRVHYERGQEPEMSQGRELGRGDRDYAGSPSTSEAISSDKFDVGGNQSTETTPKTSSSSNRLYKSHLDAFQNLSLGDVLSTARTRSPRSSTISRDAYETSDNGGNMPSTSSRSKRRGEQVEEVPSLGEVLATSRRPLEDLREKIRLARESQDFESTERTNSRIRTYARDERTNRQQEPVQDFGGSLGDILRPREESEFRDRRRFFNRSMHEQIEAEAELYLSQERSSSNRRRNRDGGHRSGTSSASGSSDYANDKSLANRALCRLHKTRFTDTSESKQECSICLEDFKYGQVLAQFGTGCKHRFHQTCIYAWFKTGDTRCPLCRQDIMG